MKDTIFQFNPISSSQLKRKTKNAFGKNSDITFVKVN